MLRRTLAAGLLAMLGLCPAVPGTSVAGIRGFALGLSTGGGVALTESPYFPLKAQPLGYAQFITEVPIAGPLGMGLSLGYHGVGPSNAAAGFLYRGHHGADAGLHLFARGRLATTGALDLFGGTRVGAAIAFDVYSLTELLFFYPSLRIAPYAEVHFPRLGPHTFELSVPWQWDFRKDLDASASVGLGLTWRWYPGKKRPPQ